MYVYGFEKKEQANIKADELEAFRELTAIILGYTEAEMKQLVSDEAVLQVAAPRGKAVPVKFSSYVMAVIYETAADLYNASRIDRKTMRKFDALCLTPIEEMTPARI